MPTISRIAPCVMNVLAGQDLFPVDRYQHKIKIQSDYGLQFVPSTNHPATALGLRTMPESAIVPITWFATILSFPKHSAFTFEYNPVAGGAETILYFGEAWYLFASGPVVYDGNYPRGGIPILQEATWDSNDEPELPFINGWRGELTMDVPWQPMANPVLACDSFSDTRTGWLSAVVTSGALDAFSLEPSRQSGMQSNLLVDLAGMVRFAGPTPDSYTTHYMLPAGSLIGTATLPVFDMDHTRRGTVVRFYVEECTPGASVTLEILDESGVLVPTSVLANSITTVTTDGEATVDISELPIGYNFTPRLTISRSSESVPSPWLMFVDVEWSYSDFQVSDSDYESANYEPAMFGLGLDLFDALPAAAQADAAAAQQTAASMRYGPTGLRAEAMAAFSAEVALALPATMAEANATTDTSYAADVEAGEAPWPATFGIGLDLFDALPAQVVFGGVVSAMLSAWLVTAEGERFVQHLAGAASVSLPISGASTVLPGQSGTSVPTVPLEGESTCLA